MKWPLVIAIGLFVGSLLTSRAAAADDAESLLVTDSTGSSVSIVSPAHGVLRRIEAGAAPNSVAVAGTTAYVTTAEGIAVIDLVSHSRSVLVPYPRPVGPPRFGEYRPGGFGIAASPDGRWVYAAVYYPDRSSRLEIMDTATNTIIGGVATGERPFQVLTSADGGQIYGIDHDSFSVTVLDAATWNTTTHVVAPLGRGAFDKPHYAVVAPDGRLVLAYQGRALLWLDPWTGAQQTAPLTADTHQHGMAWLPDGRTLLIIGTGPAGGAAGPPSLTIVDTATMTERIVPLARPHEKVVVSEDGRRAYLTGGYLLSGGWDGITVVDLTDYTTREIAVPGKPLDAVTLRGR
jgi:DNA-binding beta-propeller fold protein YncE